MTEAKIQPDFAMTTNSSSKFYSARELRDFLQSRICLIAKVGFSLIIANYVLTNIAEIASGRQEFSQLLTASRNAVSLVNATAFGAVWFVMRQGSHHWLVLTVVDVALILFFCVMVALNSWLYREQDYVFISAAMGVTFAVLARAVMVPSSAWKTFWVSIGGYLPTLIASYQSWQIGSEGGRHPSLTRLSIDCALGAVLATVISGVIYRLERQMRKAQQLGQYRLEEKIGAGAMGEVYRASHAMLRRPTAIKILREDLAGDRSLARFEREVQLTSQLTHPNTIAIYDYGRTPEGTLYYAMEYLRGVNLEQLVQLHGAQEPGRVIHILKQMCASLVEAHSVGLIHRDIKPANVILCERGRVYDFAKLVDFGLVKDLDAVGDPRATSANAVTGTPLYMSPEAIHAPGTVDHRSDLYAVGAVGYFLVTGKNLFESKNVVEICSLQMHEMPQRPSERLGKPIDQDLEGLLLQALAKDSNERPQDAADFLQRLTACHSSGAWTDKKAADWWKQHGPPSSAPAPPVAPAPVPGLPNEAATLTIDLESRDL